MLTLVSRRLETQADTIFRVRECCSQHDRIDCSNFIDNVYVNKVVLTGQAGTVLLLQNMQCWEVYFSSMNYCVILIIIGIPSSESSNILLIIFGKTD
jgi:hypothetical protein